MKARENPFAIDRIEALLDFEPEWCGTDWPTLLDRWQKLDYRAAIVGPHGSGKTTLLRTLESRLKEDATASAHHLFLNDRKPDLEQREWQVLEEICSSTTTTAVILLDGAEQLNRRAWQRFQKIIAQSNGSLRALVTQHRPSRFRWPTLLSTNPTPALLGHLIEKLAGDFRQTLTEPQIGDLLTRHHRNLREALWECYDDCSG